MNKAASLLIINDSNINTGIVHKEHKVINSGLYWHKIFVSILYYFLINTINLLTLALGTKCNKIQPRVCPPDNYECCAST